MVCLGCLRSFGSYCFAFGWIWLGVALVVASVWLGFGLVVAWLWLGFGLVLVGCGFSLDWFLCLFFLVVAWLVVGFGWIL